MKLKVIFATAVMALVFISPVVSDGPGLLADMTSGPWVPASGFRVTTAQCTTWYHLVSNCTIGYTSPVVAKVTPELDYFVFGTWGGERVTLLRSTKDPSIITTMQAIRDIGARQATLAGWIVIWPLFLALAGWSLLRKRAAVAARPATMTASVQRVADEPPEPVQSVYSPAFAGPRAGNATKRPFGRRGL